MPPPVRSAPKGTQARCTQTIDRPQPRGHTSATPPQVRGSGTPTPPLAVPLLMPSNQEARPPPPPPTKSSAEVQILRHRTLCVLLRRGLWAPTIGPQTPSCRRSTACPSTPASRPEDERTGDKSMAFHLVFASGRVGARHARRTATLNWTRCIGGGMGMGMSWDPCAAVLPLHWTWCVFRELRWPLRVHGAICPPLLPSR